MQTFPTLYKRTSTGAIQIWYGETEGSRYRTTSGQINGKHTTSEWTQCEAKNVGRSNATTAEEQAEAELQAMYKKRLERDYHEKIDDIDQERFVKPMLANSWKDDHPKLTIGETIFFQPKLDGFRSVASLDGSFSRSGKPHPGSFYINQALKESGVFDEYPNLILDGELYNHDLHDKFEDLSSALRKGPKTQDDFDRIQRYVQYHIYDVPSHRGVFRERHQFLTELMDRFLTSDSFQSVPTTELTYTGPDCIADVMAEALENNYEGGIVRRNTVYENKRTRSLLKVKEFTDEEFEIIDIESGKGNWAGHAKVVHIRLPNGQASKATVKGNKDYAKRLLEEKDQHIGHPGTVTYFRLTADGVPYLPVFKEVRWDK